MNSKNKLDLLNADAEGRGEESPSPKKFKKNLDRNKQDNERGAFEERPPRKFNVRHEHEQDDDSDVDDDEELKISREDIDFNLPKPGPHAKVTIPGLSSLFLEHVVFIRPFTF